MYATFEEFIDHQQTSGEASPASRPSPGPSSNEAPPPPAPAGGLGATTSRDVMINSHLHLSSVNSSSAITGRAGMELQQGPVSTMTSSSRCSSSRSSNSPPTARDDLALASPRRRRRPRRLRRSVDNPLLDTISAIGDADSDEGDLLPPPPPPSASSCWGPRLHPDADVVGYAGSNSVDSGYKSACPTPELPDPSAYLEHRLEKRGSLASLASTGSSSGSGSASKPRIAMGTRVMARVPRSPSSGGSAPSPGLSRRPGSDGSYYELDQLAGLRGGLLGSPPPPPHTAPAEVRNPGFTRYSPRGSPAPQRTHSPSGATPRDTHISRRAASPASPERRPRSASTGSRCSPGTRGRRPPGGLRAGSPLLASTGSLPRASSPGRRSRALSPATREEARPTSTWSRHSSPGIVPPSRSIRRPPSPIVGVHDDTDLAMLEREIDALLYGGAAGRCDPLAPPPPPDYYDLDSEFASCTCPAFSRSSNSGTTGPQTVCYSGSDGGAGGSSVRLCRHGCAHRAQPPHCSPAVAHCVLAVLDDLHCTTSGRRRSLEGRSHSSDGREIPRAANSCLLPFFDPFQELRKHKPPVDDTASESSSYDSASDYHLYEEILYETTTQSSSSKSPSESIPPPLPARPPHLFRSVISQQQQSTQETQASSQQTLRPLPQSQQQQQQPLLIPQRLQPQEVQNSQQKQTFVHYGQSVTPSSSSSSKPTDSPQHHPQPQPSCQHKHKLQEKHTDQLQQQQHLPMQHQQCQSQPKPTPPPKPPKPPRIMQSANAKLPTPPKPSPILATNNTAAPSSPSSPNAQPHPHSSGAPHQQDIEQQQQSLPKHEQPPPSDGVPGLKPQTDKPKQRSNLYSIFRDRDHRRCLSASLQQEYQQDFQQEYLQDQQVKAAVKVTTCGSAVGADDDYGFKVVPHVV